MKKTLILIMGLFACVSIRSQTHPTADKGCMILDQPGKPLARKIPATVPGRMYRMSFKADLEGCDSLLAGAHLPQGGTQWFYRSGEHRFIFTANDTLSLVFFYINTPCRVSISYVKVEEVRIESRIVCKEDSAGYRYGFNGKEKIDEQYGIEGTAYDFGARLYNSRLGRWMSTDALANLNPGSSPYRYAKNSPLLFIDGGGYFDIKITEAAKQKYGITEQQLIRMNHILQNMQSYLVQNPHVVNVIADQTGYTKEQILADAEFGKGPTILIDYNEETQMKGMFVSRSDVKNKQISVDGSIVKNFEQMTFANDDEAAAYILAMAGGILHEYTHYGDRDKNDGNITGQGAQNDPSDYPDADGTQNSTANEKYGSHRGNDTEVAMYGMVVSNRATVLPDGSKDFKLDPTDVKKMQQLIKIMGRLEKIKQTFGNNEKK